MYIVCSIIHVYTNDRAGCSTIQYFQWPVWIVILSMYELCTCRYTWKHHDSLISLAIELEQHNIESWTWSLHGFLDEGCMVEAMHEREREREIGRGREREGERGRACIILCVIALKPKGNNYVAIYRSLKVPRLSHTWLYINKSKISYTLTPKKIKL